MQEQAHQPKFRTCEVFGPTIQGEGALIGVKTHFIRLGGCDYRCSWCDSMYAVDPSQVAKLPQYNAEEILSQIDQLPLAAWVTLSGGNPALFNLEHLVNLLHLDGMSVAVETQGTVFKKWLADCELVTASPKPPSSGNTTSITEIRDFVRQWREAWDQWTPRNTLVLKIVVFDNVDWEYARSILRQFQDYECWVQVGNPVVVGTPPDHRTVLLDRLEELCEKVLLDSGMNHVRVTPQLHTLLWGNARGV